MILIDTSIWVDYFRHGDPVLDRLLDDEMVLMHPFVVGELALGNPRQRAAMLVELDRLPRSEVADHAEVRGLIERQKLYGLGIGYVDAHLLAATLLTAGVGLWTRDRRLRGAASRLGATAKVDH